MVVRLDKAQLIARQEVVAPPAQRACDDRSFELPAALLLGMFGLFMAYLAVMSFGFMARDLVLPMVVNVIFVAAFAYVPAKWATMKPDRDRGAKSWAELADQGIDTPTGRVGAGEAATLVLLLPACILFWGVAVVMIAASV